MEFYFKQCHKESETLDPANIIKMPWRAILNIYSHPFLLYINE